MILFDVKVRLDFGLEGKDKRMKNDSDVVVI